MSRISRREARVCAVKVLYGVEFHKDEDMSELFDMTVEEGEIESNDFAKSLFLGVCEHLEDVDLAISENARGWKIERISRMSLAIMRVCVYELLFTDIPSAIAINEAIEIDKIYDSDDAPSFVNGILNAVARSKNKDSE